MTAPLNAGPSVEQAVALYAAGYFPMDDPAEARGPLPFYAAEQRALFELDEISRAAVRRRLRRSLRAGEAAGLRLTRDECFDEVVAACARPREPGDGVWLTPRLAHLYRRLHEAGLAHSFEVHAGDELAVRGFSLCDIQLPTEHTTRVGARLVPREEYERRLRQALR